MWLLLLEKFVYCCWLWIYLPLYLFGLIMIKLKLSINELKLATGIRVVYHAVMSPLSKKSKVSDVGNISTEEEIDFLTHRSPGYLKRMTLWTAKELARLVLRTQTIELISDSQLCFIMFHTVFAYNLKWNEERNMYEFDLGVMKKFTLFQGFYWEAEHVFVDPASCKVVILMVGGEELHSDCNLQEKADYDLAKLHLQVCLTYFAPGLAHNYVHFVFPSSVCVAAKTMLNRKGVLHQLLSPHFRFVERLNHQALRICHASSNRRTLFDRFVCFWKTFPITKEQFSGSMEQKLKEYYFELGSQECDEDKKKTVIIGYTHWFNINVCGTKKKMISGKNGTHIGQASQRKHTLFPPAYVTDSNMQNIPYLKFLSQYYWVIRDFVLEIEPFIDSEEWKEISSEISKSVPRFEQVDMVDAISTFIHLVSVVHSADHISYIDYFAKRYGCMSIRTPFERFSNTSFWEDFHAKSGIPVEVIKKNPLKLILQQDVMRARCFINVFVDYIPSPTCDLSLLKTDYGCCYCSADVAERNFKSNLRSLDGNLKIQDSPIPIKRGKDDIRPKGLQLVKLDAFIRSNCF